jgi:hypothetical protein
VLRGVGILVAASALAAPVAAAAAKPPVAAGTHTAAGMAAARRAVLALEDLGPGWKAGTAGPATSSLGCGGATSGPGVVETGKAVSPTFSRSAAGPFVSQAVFVYGSAAQAQQVWQQTVGKPALTCLARSVTGGSTKDVKFTILHALTLPAPGAGTRSAAYRIVASAHSKLQTVSAYVDLVLVGRGDAVTEISYSGFSQPIDRSLELSVARALATRL